MKEQYAQYFSLEDIRYARDKYLASFEGLDFTEYIRREKISRIRKIPKSLYDDSDIVFSDFDIHPNDLDFDLQFVENSDQLKQFNELLEVTSSQLVEWSVPGRSMKILVTERHTGKVFGFIRLGSPMINMKPRNTLLGTNDYTQNPGLREFNDASYLGQIIVPVQPAGFNYAAGKLLALMCVSHEVRERFNSKYDGMNALLFETTSLYGSIKSHSQYDGLKPFIRKGGQSESTFMPALQKKYFKPLRQFFEDKLGEKLIRDDQLASRKMKMQARMESIIRNTLVEYGYEEEANEFSNTVKNIQQNMTTQKNYYYSTFGFANSIDYLMGRSDSLKKADNYDRFYLENIIEWWRNKAKNRYEKLQSEERIRHDLELWTNTYTQESVDIVR